MNIRMMTLALTMAGAVLATPWAIVAEGAGMTSEQVKEVQQALQDRGHDPGPIDGIVGPRTRSAIEQFQQAEGIQPSGQLDAETLTLLGVEARPTDTPAASPPTAPTN